MRKWLLGLLVGDLIVVNGLVGYVFIKSQMVANEPVELNAEENELLAEVKTEYVDRCGDECKKYVDAKLAQVGSLVGVQISPTTKVIPTVAPTIKPKTVTTLKKTRKEEILTIPGSGSSSSNTWEDVGGTNFYFDTRDYPGIVEVYFEANMRLVNGNGYGYVRLYDGTNNIGVTGSDNNTSSQADVWTKSQKVYFWAGRNLIRVQARTLTADTVMFNQGRLKIVVEN